MSGNVVENETIIRERLCRRVETKLTCSGKRGWMQRRFCILNWLRGAGGFPTCRTYAEPAISSGRTRKQEFRSSVVFGTL